MGAISMRPLTADEAARVGLEVAGTVRGTVVELVGPDRRGRDRLIVGGVRHAIVIIGKGLAQWTSWANDSKT